MTRARGRRGTERGFTLAEMMVVIAIIGVLCALATVSMRPQARTLDVANRVGDLTREASRTAVTVGPVRSDVVLAQLASGLAPAVARARTRISASGTSGAATTFTVEQLVEAAAPATTVSWVTVQTYTTDTPVAGVSWASGTGSNSALSAGLSTSWSAFHAYCQPDGTCQAATLFFQNTRDGSASPNYRARLSILPLGGALYSRADWN